MRKLLFIVCITMVTMVHGQYFDAGHEPASLKWYTIDTRYYTLVFPKPFEREAQQLAAFLDSLSFGIDSTTGFHWKKIPIVLHTGKTISNGFVGWAPGRMEIYTIPPADNYAQQWLEQMGIHEGTHVYQFSRSYQGMTKLLGTLFGEHIPAAVIGLYFPFWFIEGEAVYNETKFSYAGRGRDPSFEAGIRTHLTVKEKSWSYDKAYLGSYKDFVPNYYELGYLLYAYGVEHYGDTLWDRMADYVARNPWNPMAFKTALKKYTGCNKTEFYSKAMEDITAAWTLQQQSEHPNESLSATKKQSDWQFYRYVQPFEQNRMIAEVTTLDHTRRIVVVNGKRNGKDKTIIHPGYHFNEGFNYCDGLICWSEYVPHPRWTAIEYSDIMIYDITSKQKFRITHNERYFSPVLIPTNSPAVEIFAVRYNENHTHSIVKTDAYGNVTQTTELPHGRFASNLAWWDTKTLLLFTETGAEGKRIAAFNPATNTFSAITPWTNANVSHPKGYGDTILFAAGFNNINNIFAWHNHQLFQVTDELFGAFYPAVDKEGTLFFSSYQPNGMEAKRIKLNAIAFMPVEFNIHPEGFIFADTLTPPAKPLSLSMMCDSCYRVDPYRRLPNLFRFHSGAPAAILPDETKIKLGASIFSQNTLSTSFLSSGYIYEPGQKDHTLFMNFRYKGFWPVIDLRYEFLKPWFEDDQYPELGTFRWDEHYTNLQLSLPLYYSNSNYNSIIRPSISFTYLSRIADRTTHERFITGDLSYAGVRFYAYRLQKRAHRNIYPRWGQLVELNKLTTTGGTLRAGNAWSCEAVTYWPGLLKNHGIRIYAGYQEKTTEKFGFSQLIASPRGYANGLLYNGFSLKSNYQFPVISPDFALGPVAYLKRVRIKLFYDVMKGDGREQQLDKRSYGLETIADIHLLRHFAPVEFGVGMAMIENQKIFTWLIFSVAFEI